MGCCQGKEKEQRSESEKNSSSKEDLIEETAECEQTGMKIRRMGKLAAQDDNNEEDSDEGRTALVTSQCEVPMGDVQFDTHYDAHEITRRQTSKKSKGKKNKEKQNNKQNSKPVATKENSKPLEKMENSKPLANFAIKLTSEKLVVDPTFLIWTCPIKGRDSECQSFRIKNMTSENRVTFKIKGTKLDRFLVAPSIGILEPQSAVKIDVQPKKINTTDGFNNTDCFNVLLASIAEGEEADVTDMWKKNGPADKLKLPFKLRVQIELKDQT